MNLLDVSHAVGQPDSEGAWSKAQLDGVVTLLAPVVKEMKVHPKLFCLPFFDIYRQTLLGLFNVPLGDLRNNKKCFGSFLLSVELSK